MQCLLDNLRSLESAQGYTLLGMYMQANQELEAMSADTRLWPEVLVIKLAIYDGLQLWDLVEIVAIQLKDSAKGNARWENLAEQAFQEMRAARRLEQMRAGGVKAAVR